MTEKQALEILLDRVNQRIFNMSANYLMTKPKQGINKQDFDDEHEIRAILKYLIEER